MAEVKLDDITNNSNAARRMRAERGEEPVTEVFDEDAPLSMRKPSFFGRMFGRINFADNFEGAGQTVLEEVVIPTLIDGLRDVIYTATDYILYGGGQRTSRSRRGGYTSYSKKSGQQKRSVRRTAPSAASYYFTYDERSQADKDLDMMRDVIEQRECVTVMDMFAIAKRPTSNYTYNDWGWYDLKTAMVRRTSDGRFYLDLPKPVPIED